MITMPAVLSMRGTGYHCGRTRGDSRGSLLPTRGAWVRPALAAAASDLLYAIGIVPHLPVASPGSHDAASFARPEVMVHVP